MEALSDQQGFGEGGLERGCKVSRRESRMMEWGTMYDQVRVRVRVSGCE